MIIHVIVKQFPIQKVDKTFNAILAGEDRFRVNSFDSFSNASMKISTTAGLDLFSIIILLIIELTFYILPNKIKYSSVYSEF